MFRLFLYNAARFLFVWLAQVLIFNRLEIHEFINPCVYVFAILMLPIETPVWVVLVCGFLLGGAVDASNNTGGMHAAATTLLAFVRKPWLQTLAPRGGYEPETTNRQMELRWFAAYAGLLIAVHHIALFLLEAWDVWLFPEAILKAIATGLFTMALVLMIRYLFGRSELR